MSQPSSQLSPSPPATGNQPGRPRFRYPRPLFWIALFGFFIPYAVVQVPREIGRWHFASAIRARVKGEAAIAYREMESAMYWFPNNPGLLIRQAEWKLKDGEKEEALAEADRAVEISKEDPLVRNARGELLLNAGEFARAIDDLKAAKEFSDRSGNPPPEAALNQLAYARALAKIDLDSALHEVSEAIEIVSDKTDVPGHEHYVSKIAYLDTRGYIYFLQGENEVALTDLNEAVNRIGVSTSIKASNDNDYVASAIKKLISTSDDKARARGLATIFYHRLLVLDALGRQKEADKDRETVRKLIGQDPDETLF